METKVGVKEFRAHLPAYLDSVSPIAITRHGKTNRILHSGTPGSKPSGTRCTQTGCGEIGSYDV